MIEVCSCVKINHLDRYILMLLIQFCSSFLISYIFFNFIIWSNLFFLFSGAAGIVPPQSKTNNHSSSRVSGAKETSYSNMGLLYGKVFCKLITTSILTKHMSCLWLAAFLPQLLLNLHSKECTFPLSNTHYLINILNL